MPIQLGSRIFAPRLFTTLLACAGLALFVSLGRWQLQRADQKRALYDEFAQGTDATQTLGVVQRPLTRYQHVLATGRYDPARQILIDNMTDQSGRAGYFVVTPFELDAGGWILVNRGWVPVGASRAQQPLITVADGRREIRGRTDHLPIAGMRLSSGQPLSPPFPVVANFPTRAEIAALLRENAWSPAADVVLLDAADPDGYVRAWQPPGFAPVRHIAYAVQWFGLAVALGVIYVVTNFKRVPPRAPAP